MKVFKRIFSAAMIIITAGFIFQSCATPKNMEGAILINGTMNMLPMEGGCWILEVGNIRNKEFYQLIGDESDLRKVQIEEAQVTVRVVPKPDMTTACQVGKVAELVEIVEVRTR
ncbi:MAG: hypothetical protein V4642_12705 [Bacteroidota bacterium]